MDKSVTVIVPEPHISDKNIANRFDYVKEIKDYMNVVKDILSSYFHLIEEGCKVNVCFMGDLFNREFKDIEEFGYWYSYFVSIRSMVTGMYSLIGNHELSYSKDNPFWLMMNDLDDKYIKFYNNKSVKAKGDLQLIDIVDKIYLADDIVVNFGHYRMYPKYDKSMRINIELCHNSIMSNEISNILKEKYERDPLEGYINYDNLNSRNVFEGYDYVYLGHMHKAYGLFNSYDDVLKKNTRLRYLASLGRTNSLEVNDMDLTRVIPVLHVDNEGNLAVEEKEIYLLERSKCINKTKVKNKEELDLDKRYKESMANVKEDISPVIGIQNLLGKPVLIQALNMALVGNRPNNISIMKNKSERKLDIS